MNGRAQESDLGVLNEVKSADELSVAKAGLTDSSRFAEVEQGMVYLGMVGIKDPARPEVSCISRFKCGGRLLCVST